MLVDPLWLEFQEVVAAKTDGTWVFRGHGSAAYGLRPSIGRQRTWGAKSYDAGLERLMFDDFKVAAPRYLRMPDADIEILALAQHYGLPTRLLDWSRSPLIAAWFAVENDELHDDSCVLMTQVPASQIKWCREIEKIFDTSQPDPVFVRFPNVSDRINAQIGLFSFHPAPNSDWTPKPPLTHDRFVIPSASKPFFRQALRVQGIDHVRLKPDLDGLCASIASRYRSP